MAQVTCRCGETLKVTSGDPDRLTCPRCGAKIRIRRSPAQRPEATESGDGYVRFNCPCGRRLKVRGDERPEAGKCPDCGRIVPVPEFSLGGSSGCLSRLERPGPDASRWSHGRHGCRRSGTLGAMGEPPPGRIESQPAIGRRVHHVASGTERRFPNGNGPGQLLTCDEDGGWPSGLFPLRQTFAHERHRLPLLWRACAQAIAGVIMSHRPTRQTDRRRRPTRSYRAVRRR